MSNSKKIMILTTCSGFLPKFEENNVKILQRLGWKVHYASNFENPAYTCKKEELEQKGIVCHHIDISKSPYDFSRNMKSLKSVLKLLKQEEIKVLHCHNPNGGVIGRLAGLLARKVFVIYTAHGLHYYKGAPKKNWLLYYPMEKILARYTNAIITINEEDYQSVGRLRLKKNGKRVRIPGVGFDAKKYCKDHSDREECRKYLGVKKNEFLVVSVGELNENKNHEVVIDAIAQLNDPSIRYFIFGEGMFRERLQEKIEGYNLQDRIKLMGYRDDINRMLQGADCFVFPSIREGLGMAAIEAMGCSLPLIVSNNRGSREYAKHNYNAFICDWDNSQQFAEAIRSMKEKQDRRIEMGIQSHHISKGFTHEVTNRIMHEFYTDLTADLFKEAVDDSNGKK
ncbi:MAG: glycosyltransferase family 4 protein [bacterium]|nr:glycosyltransferase family 4 protein [bacterium]